MKKAEKANKKDILIELEKLESEISKIVVEDNRNKVVENFSSLKKHDGTTNTSGVWKIVRKVFPKNNETLPFAKKDFDGNLISSQNDLKKLYLNTFQNRLRHRQIKPGLEDLKTLKEEDQSSKTETI